MKLSLNQLHQFIKKAALAAYAGGGKEALSQRLGFVEYEYREGDFYYRDSYTGYLTSAGQEVVWYENKPIWTQSYGGGMAPRYRNDINFASECIRPPHIGLIRLSG